MMFWLYDLTIGKNIAFTGFDPFLLNFSEKEREQYGIFDACGCMWMYLDDMRASGGSSHVHYNLFYDPTKHDGPILPPAAALAPTLWPKFHLRWSCPSEAQAGEVEAQCRSLVEQISELQKVIYTPLLVSALYTFCTLAMTGYICFSEYLKKTKRR